MNPFRPGREYTFYRTRMNPQQRGKIRQWVFLSLFFCGILVAQIWALAQGGGIVWITVLANLFGLWLSAMMLGCTWTQFQYAIARNGTHEEILTLLDRS